MIFFRNQQSPRISSLLRTAIITGIVLIPQSAAGLKMKGLKGVMVDENTYDKETGHATFDGTFSNNQGDTFGHDVDWYDIHEDVSLILEDNKPIKLGPVVDEKDNVGQVEVTSESLFGPGYKGPPSTWTPPKPKKRGELPCYCMPSSKNNALFPPSHFVERFVFVIHILRSDRCHKKYAADAAFNKVEVTSESLFGPGYKGPPSTWTPPKYDPKCDCMDHDYCKESICAAHGFRPTPQPIPRTPRPTRKPINYAPRPRPRPKADKWKNTIHADEIDLKDDIPSDCLGSNYDVELRALADEDDEAHFVLTAKVSSEEKSLDYKCPDFLTFTSIDGKKLTHRVNDPTEFIKCSSFLLGKASLEEIMNAESSVAAIKDTKYDLTKNSCIHYAGRIWRNLRFDETNDLANFLIDNLLKNDGFLNIARHKSAAGGLRVLSYVTGQGSLKDFVKDLVYSQLYIKDDGESMNGKALLRSERVAGPPQSGQL
eukprot:scaffold156035_cov53-Cyclotella_meneghiniana.AAC.1